MILEMDNYSVLMILESEQMLRSKTAEALHVLHSSRIKEQPEKQQQRRGYKMPEKDRMQVPMDFSYHMYNNPQQEQQIHKSMMRQQQSQQERNATKDCPNTARYMRCLSAEEQQQARNRMHPQQHSMMGVEGTAAIRNPATNIIQQQENVSASNSRYPASTINRNRTYPRFIIIVY